MTAYYVQPEPSASGGEAYWLEGYAVGDAKFAAAQSDGTSTTLTAPTRVQLTGMLSEGEVASLFGGNRVVAGALAQSPASATLAGFARVRPTGMQVDATSTTLIASTRVKSSQAISRAKYVLFDYWQYGYDYAGDAGNVKIAASVTYNSNGVLSSAASEVDAGVTRKRQTGYLSEANVTSFAGSLRIRDGIGIQSDATGTFLVPETTRIVTVAYLTEGQSTVFGALSEKWIDQAEDADVWTDQSEDADNWTVLTTFTDPYVREMYWALGYTVTQDYDETWTILGEQSETWTPIPEASKTWTTQSPLT